MPTGRRAILWLTAGAALCGCSRVPFGPVAVEWRALDSLNATLPEGVAAYEGRNTWLPLRAWYVRIEPQRARISVRVVLSDDAADRRETVASFAMDPGVCVAVNGGYFAMDRTPARHAGLLLLDDSLAANATAVVWRDSIEYETARAALGITPAGGIEIAWAVTRNDSVFAWDHPVDHRPGQPASVASDHGERVWAVRDALGAGPMLLRDGEFRVSSDQEGFFGTSIPRIHPRTAAGVTEDGALILLVVDGRQPESRGVSLQELAAIMRGTGAVDALNLDGGGSSALVVNGLLLNRPVGDTIQREVMSAVVAVCDSER